LPKQQMRSRQAVQKRNFFSFSQNRSSEMSGERKSTGRLFQTTQPGHPCW